MLVIKNDLSGSVGYYKYVENGKPVTGFKNKAAKFGDKLQADLVCRQLRMQYPSGQWIVTDDSDGAE